MKRRGGMGEGQDEKEGSSGGGVEMKRRSGVREG